MGKEIQRVWQMLNDGKRVTNGDIVLWYEDGMLDSNPPVNNPYMFNTEELAEEWHEVITELPVDTQLYCRWYHVTKDGSLSVDNSTWHKIEEDPKVENVFRLGEALPKIDIVGETDAL